MKNTFGSALTVTIFGESHGPAIGAVMDGLAPGIVIDEAFIAAEMDKRRAAGQISTARKEADRVEFLSGVYQGCTTGTSLCFVIQNQNTRSEDYEKTANLLRPGHADYTALEKYNGYADPRGGGHFSGRLTAPIVAAGAICRLILAAQGVSIATHIAQCANIMDEPFPKEEKELAEVMKRLNEKSFATINDVTGEEMQKNILQAKQNKNSLGGVLETVVTGLQAGIGEPFFGSVESVLSALLFSIPAVKGVEFGLGFGFASLFGSQANDEFTMRGGAVKTATNNNGGINGGITNGMPLLFRTAVKPTPSIALAQSTIDVDTMQPAVLEIKGRHDPCVLHRACVVADAMTAIGLVDLFAQHFGTNGLAPKD